MKDDHGNTIIILMPPALNGAQSFLRHKGAHHTLWLWHAVTMRWAPQHRTISMQARQTVARATLAAENALAWSQPCSPFCINRDAGSVPLLCFVAFIVIVHDMSLHQG